MQPLIDQLCPACRPDLVPNCLHAILTLLTCAREIKTSEVAKRWLHIFIAMGTMDGPSQPFGAKIKARHIRANFGSPQPASTVSPASPAPKQPSRCQSLCWTKQLNALTDLHQLKPPN